MRTLAFLLCVLPALAAATQPPESCAPAPDDRPPPAIEREYGLAIIDRAATGTDARALVAAAAWWFVVDSQTGKHDASAAKEMLARAAELAGPDPVAWALISAACGRDCTLEPAPFDRWLALDPDNGVAWIEAVARANATGDVAGARDALARAARAPRIEGYWVHAVRASLSVARAVPLPAELVRYAESQGFESRDAVDVAAIGVVLAQATPGTAYIGEACRNNPDWRDDCLRLGRNMEAIGDGNIVRMQGRAIQRRLLPPDSDDARALAERTRVYDWQVHRAALLNAAPAALSASLRSLLSAGSEAAATERQLRDAGIPLAPPPGWTVEAGRAELFEAYPPPERDREERCEPPATPSKP